MNKRKTGSLLEDAACDLLKQEGFKIICRNFRAGRLGEIDIIAAEGEYICFIEVKGRKNDSFGFPAEAVSRDKIKKIRLVSEFYITDKKLHGRNIRYDVLELFYSRTNCGIQIKSHNLIRNAF